MSDDTMISMLRADGPDPDLADRLATFGRFVGAWGIDGHAIAEDGTVTRFVGEWRFGWVLEGRAIQDVLAVRPAGAAPGQRSRGIGIGSTVRLYDPDRDAWLISWMGPSDGEFSTLFAHESGDRIVLEGQWTAGRQWSGPGTERRFEWSFSEIAPASFRWQGRLSDDGGATWRLAEEMLATRRG